MISPVRARGAFTRLFVASSLLTLVGTIGCGIDSRNVVVAPVQPSLTGSVHGGQQPVTGSHLYLFAAGANGAGGSSISLITSTSSNPGGGGTDANSNNYLITDAGGSFNLTGTYSCVSGQQVYVLALGGNPGIGGNVSNSAIAEMAALGTCPSSGAFAGNRFISLNEITTVAATYALSGFLTGPQNLSIPANNSTAAANLSAAFANAALLANTSSGAASSSTPDGTGTIPYEKINTLGNMIAACINSSGSVTNSVNGVATPCGILFADATSDGTSTGPQPTETITALVNIANHPYTNVLALYNLTSPTAPFQPSLVSVPNDLTIAISYPTITSISPSAVPAGSPSTVVTLSGSGFTSTTIVKVNGLTVTSGQVGSTAMVAIVPAAQLATGGYFPVVAQDGAVTTPSVNLEVDNLIPGAITINPTSGITGSAVALSITGTNFIPGSIVQVNGFARATTYVSPTQLSAQLIAADVTAAAKLNITVVNPTPGGGSSTNAVFTGSQPTQFIAGSAASYIYIYGTNLTSNSVISWNGASLPTGYALSGTSILYLYAGVPASLIANVGTASIIVTNSLASPPVSASFSVPIVNPPAPTVTSLSASAVPIGVSTPIFIYGTNFTAKSVVALNGINLPTTYSNSGQLGVTLPATSVSLPGNYAITVATPAPGGGTTAPTPFTAYIPIVNNSMIYNPVNGLYYLSIPSSVGAPYGNSIVSVDPATGALGTPIQVGSEPNKLAISSDGTILWVGLDGASAVRQVNLTTNTAGLQFYLGGNLGVYATPGTALALAALPGSPNSVVVSSSNEYTNLFLAIYDNGVLRGSSATNSTYSGGGYAVLANGTRQEIYVGAGSSYSTFTYGSTGLTLKATATVGNYASYSYDEMEIANGILYTDSGTAYDAEAGALLGTFYSSGSTVASGSTAVDTTLAKVFILDNSAAYYNNYQIQVFNPANYNPVSSSVIPVSFVSGGTAGVNYPTRLSRWGSNGLAFRTGAGVFSFQSNLVQDLSTTSADLAVLLNSSGTSTGAVSTYVATVSNNGPSDATGVTFTALLPATGTLVSATPSAGACSSGATLTCDLGKLGNGASATVTILVNQLTAGSSTLTAKISASQNDPNLANNQAASTATISGNSYNPSPVVAAVSPATILVGSNDTTITVTGAGFSSNSSVMLGGSALTTSFASSTTLTATVPAAQFANIGWAPITVSSPTPGGGTSNAIPLSIYNVITLGVNHILYDPFSRKIMASVASGSSSVTGNSIVAITPETASLGAAVPIGSQPSNLALTSDGQILYTILSGSQSVARFNMLTQAADYTYSVPPPANADGGVALRGIATQPGTENTIALDIASFSGNAIYDFNPATKSAAIRGQVSGPYSGSCIVFPDAGDLLAFDIDTSGSTLDHYTVTSAGFQYYNYQQYSESTLNHFGCFKTSGPLAFSVSGGVANYTTNPATQLGVFPLPSGYGYAGLQNIAPDTSLQRVFFGVNSSASGSYSSYVDSIEAFDPTTYLPSASLPIDFATIEGTTSFTLPDLIRWGQDGLAALTSTGHIYLLRGPFVVPQLLTQNSAANLTSSSLSTIAHGTGNTILTLTGSNFIPGVAVTWNGSYRTTTIISPTQVTVAIPASDLAALGSAALVATNPGASASATITVTIN
jgi:uncharacterized repeat protein (TIGR01451 family)